MTTSGECIALRADGLTKRYGDLVAVDDLSFAVRRGEIFGFLGPNGAGKTTALKMMCGLLRPDAGSVEIAGRPLVAGRGAGASAIGVAPQNAVFWPLLTCREQLEFVGRSHGLTAALARERVAELLAALGLQEKADQLGRTLSGGMQRRLNIALGLVHRPEILLLDEPQAGLDPQSRVLVRDYVRALAGAMTVVITTHDMEEAEKLCQRVCIVDRGRLLALDTVAGIKRQAGEGDRFELELNVDLAAALLPALGELPAAPAVVVKGATLCFAAAGGNELLARVLRVVAERGLGLVQLRMRRATLEDVFIRLTGRGLRE
ncbi:MAG: ABC transporter ATP-binding protein [Deltaproteobacteria bacterium]|nr:ABC transporter ATP-binding protein [Deltaproteobacteria bacterium]